MGAGILSAAAGIAAGGWFGVQITRDGIRSASSETRPYILKKTKLDDFSGIKIDITSELTSNFCRLRMDPPTWNTLWTEPAQNLCGAFPAIPLPSTQKGILSAGIFLDIRSLSTFSDSVVRLYLRKAPDCSDVEISSEFGSMDISGFTADTLTLNLGYGDLDMKDIRTDKADIYLDFEIWTWRISPPTPRRSIWIMEI